jgi:hypothetical protein
MVDAQSRNRALTDVVAAGNAALRLPGFEALAGLVLLVRGEGRLAAEFDALGLGVGPAQFAGSPVWAGGLNFIVIGANVR